jgi:hypothetical protein
VDEVERVVEHVESSRQSHYVTAVLSAHLDAHRSRHLVAGVGGCGHLGGEAGIDANLTA